MSGQQRAGNATPASAYPGMGTAINQQQYLQQALQQNPQLASQITQRLQASAGQVVAGQAHQQPAAPNLAQQQAQYLQQQQQLLRQQQQQQQQQRGTASTGIAQSGSMQMRPPAKQPVAMARPAAGFSAGAAANVGAGQLQQPSPVSGLAAAVASGSKPPMSAAEMVPAAKRKKRPFSDTRLPEKIAAYVPESALYTQLQDYERQIDACLAQRQAQVQDAVRRPLHVAKKLRIYIYNTHSGQESATPSSGGTSPDPPSWALIIQGKLIETPIATTAMQQAPTAVYHPPSHPFTHYVRRLKVDLDSAQYENGEEQVVWERGQHGRNHRDSFEIRRRGSEDVEASIEIEVDNQPDTFSLSQALSQVLGMKQGTRAAVMHTLWAYIKAHRLQNSEQTQIIECDARLTSLFKAKSVKLSSLSERLNDHLQPVDPLTVRYTVKTAGLSPSQPESYDIAVEVKPATALDQATAPLLQHLNTTRDVEQLDQRILTAVRKVHEHKRRRAFYMGFSQSPVDFINALVASQGRDLRVMKTETGAEYEAMQRSDLFRGKWVEDAVLRHLHSRLAASV